jgi:hypothetical protein
MTVIKRLRSPSIPKAEARQSNSSSAIEMTRIRYLNPLGCGSSIAAWYIPHAIAEATPLLEY